MLNTAHARPARGGWELVEVDERLVLLTVDGVDPEAVMVARSSLNRLREA